MKILFICTGNICRSPTAHAIARQRSKAAGRDLIFDSAAISRYHVGQEPDERAVAEGEARGISFDGIIARKITDRDFEESDLIFAMDKGHLRSLLSMSGQRYHNKIKLFLEFCETDNPWGDEVIDPYYDGIRSFKMVYKAIDDSINNLLEKL